MARIGSSDAGREGNGRAAALPTHISVGIDIASTITLNKGTQFLIYMVFGEVPGVHNGILSNQSCQF